MLLHIIINLHLRQLTGVKWVISGVDLVYISLAILFQCLMSNQVHQLYMYAAISSPVDTIFIAKKTQSACYAYSYNYYT